MGLATGDAVGTTLEFKRPGSFEPLSDMVGGGPFDLRPGEWTDDTSMALCLAESLSECGGFDPADQMDRYVRWQRDGHLSSTGACFDIGATTLASLTRYRRTGDPLAGVADPHSAGNGSLMRPRAGPAVLRGGRGTRHRSERGQFAHDARRGNLHRRLPLFRRVARRRRKRRDEGRVAFAALCPRPRNLGANAAVRGGRRGRGRLLPAPAAAGDRRFRLCREVPGGGAVGRSPGRRISSMDACSPPIWATTRTPPPPSTARSPAPFGVWTASRSAGGVASPTRRS